MTIKETFKSLTDDQKKSIMDSFNKLEFYRIDLDNGFYICVHATDLDDCEIIDRSEFWCVGKEMTNETSNVG